MRFPAALAALGLLAMVTACGSAVDEPSGQLVGRTVEASPTPSRSADLGEAKPQPTPTGDLNSEPVSDGRVRVWPTTEDVEDEGKYLFNAPHCGLDWMIDFDASFWKAIKPDDYGDGEHYPFFYNSDAGTITFTSADSAIYQASTGEEIMLERIEGPIVIHLCA